MKHKFDIPRGHTPLEAANLLVEQLEAEGRLHLRLAV
jgi:hypothetical protein